MLLINYFQNIREVLEYLNKSDWSDRKDGLFSLKYYLSQHDLSPDELKRVTDSLTRMFMDSQTKVRKKEESAELIGSTKYPTLGS